MKGYTRRGALQLMLGLGAAALVGGCHKRKKDIYLEGVVKREGGNILQIVDSKEHYSVMTQLRSVIQLMC